MTDIYQKLGVIGHANMITKWEAPIRTNFFLEGLSPEDCSPWSFTLTKTEGPEGFYIAERHTVHTIIFPSEVEENNNNDCRILFSHGDDPEPQYWYILSADEVAEKLESVLDNIRPRITKKRRDTGVLTGLPTIYLEIYVSKHQTENDSTNTKPIYVHPECCTTYDRYLTIAGGTSAPSPVGIGEWRTIREVYPDGSIVTLCGRTCRPCDALNEKLLASYFSLMGKHQLFYALVVDSQKETTGRLNNSHYHYPHHFYEEPCWGNGKTKSGNK
ncbi:hypothetical protein CC614_09100 [Salmonella enterica subsp. enterica serovar Newport]|nr:hypothetical protein [Salmonella enterica subsp. enterica serovar Newport]